MVHKYSLGRGDCLLACFRLLVVTSGAVFMTFLMFPLNRMITEKRFSDQILKFIFWRKIVVCWFRFRCILLAYFTASCSMATFHHLNQWPEYIYIYIYIYMSLSRISTRDTWKDANGKEGRKSQHPSYQWSIILRRLSPVWPNLLKFNGHSAWPRLPSLMK